MALVSTEIVEPGKPKPGGGGGGNSGGGSSSGSGMFDGAVNEAKAMMEAASKAAVELAIAQSKFQIANKGGENTQSLTR